MSERKHELVNQPVFAHRSGQQTQRGIGGHLRNKMLTVKRDHLVMATAPGHHRNVVNRIMPRHRGDRRGSIFRGEFELGMQLPQANHVSFGQCSLHGASCSVFRGS